MVSAATFILLRCNSTTPTTTRQSPFLKAKVAQAVLQHSVLARSILQWTHLAMGPSLTTRTLITGPIFSIQRWTETQFLFPTWHMCNSTTRMGMKFSTQITTVLIHQNANFPGGVLISNTTLTTFTPCTTLTVRPRRLSQTPSLCSTTTWTASILLATQSNSALLRKGAMLLIGIKAKPFPMVTVKPLSRSTLSWLIAGFLATVAALSPTNPEAFNMFEKFEYHICRKK